MLAIVLHSFIDKNTNKSVLKGKKIEVSKKRFSEINNAGYGTLLKKIEEKEVDKNVKGFKK